MKNKSNYSSVSLVLLGLCLWAAPIKAETITVDDTTFSVGNVPAGAVGGVLSGRWGIWNAGSSSFVQAVTTSLNAGYADLSGPELAITLNQTTAGNYSAGTAMALAIFTNGSADSSALNWSAATRGIVLTDASWVAPSWANNAIMVPFNFSANTIARIGSYNYNGGSEIFTLAVIPEPSSLSLIALGGLGLVAFRGRRK